MAHLLRSRGIRHELDVWGEDSPHDWPSWRRMAVKHLAGLG
jgi:esterase/lipase superfamily enzyme